MIAESILVMKMWSLEPNTGRGKVPGYSVADRNHSQYGTHRSVEVTQWARVCAALTSGW
jgi:hypothetical protein